MGLYDTIEVPCPKCGGWFPAQSKSGPCECLRYFLQHAPEEVLKDVNRHAPFHCNKCGSVFHVDLNRKVTSLRRREDPKVCDHNVKLLFKIPRWIQYTLYAIAAMVAAVVITGLATWAMYRFAHNEKVVCGTYCHQVTEIPNDTFCFPTCIDKEKFESFNLPDL